MKKAMFVAVAACLIFAACGNNGGKNGVNTKGDNDNKEVEEPKVEVVIPDNFTEYDCSGFTINYPNDLEVTWDGDEMVNLSNDDGSVFIDATYSDWGTREINLKKSVNDFVSLFKNQGWEPIGDVAVNGNIGTCKLENSEEFNNFFIVSNGKDHTVSGSVKYDKELAEAFEAYVTPIIYSIKVK